MVSLAPSYTDIGFGITAIDVDYSRPLLASSHLIVENNRAAFVDTGTAHSVPLLLAVLEDKGISVDAVDFVLLTHIHLDHAGGAGTLMQVLPNARCVVHPRGARHLSDPEKLVAGTRAVYGDEKYRQLYGEVVPIDGARIDSTEDGEIVEFAGRPFEFFYTEGHARHHHCIADAHSRGIFTGDSFGVSYRELDTLNGEFVFPTTTPVQFDPVKAHEAVDEIAGRRPDRVYLTHFSEVTSIDRLARDLHQCLDGFVEQVEALGATPDREARLTEALFNFLSDRLDAHGFDADSERRHAVLDTDCDLNAQGLLHWYDHRSN